MPDVERYDLVVLGAGPAGEKGAALGAYFGRRVALVERRGTPGGASVHTGTLPSKTLREAALYLTGFRRRELYGMTLRLDRKRSLRQLLGRLADVTARQTHQIDRNLERHRIETVTGQARFLDAGTVAVHDARGARDAAPRRRASFLIATGSSPLPPRGLTFDDPDVEDSDRILDLDRIPRSLAVVGGGVIGCEYASIFAALGTHVTLIEGRDRLLGFLDAELSSALKVSLERMGADVILGDAVENLSRVPGLSEDALRLTLKSGRELVAGKVLFSAGRRGNTEGLGLEAAGRRLRREGAHPGRRDVPHERAGHLRRRRHHRLPRSRGHLDGAGADGGEERPRPRGAGRPEAPLPVRRLHDPRDLDDRRDGGGAPGEGHPVRGGSRRATRTTRAGRSTATSTAS